MKTNLKKKIFSLTCCMLLHLFSFAQSPEYEAKKKKLVAEISPFEKIAQHITTDVTLEYEDNDFIVFEPLSKQAPVHLLIVPKKRINTLNDLVPDDQALMGKMMLLAKEMAKKKGIDQTGYRIAMNTNEDAGQSVFHIHLHLLGGNKVGVMVDQTYRNNLKKDAANQMNFESKDKQQIRAMLQTFMDCIATKDSIKMYSLFQNAPVAWVGVYKDSTYKKILAENAGGKIAQTKNSDYKSWFRKVVANNFKQEKFYNVEIIEDGAVASVAFDYNFSVNQSKQNWGKEFWHLVKENGNWKIASVVFSIELEKYLQEPNNVNETTLNAKKAETLRAMANNLRETAQLPALSIAVSRKGEVVFAEGFGYADVEQQKPVTPTTQFRTASVAKIITATALAKMAQEGTIDLNAPISNYLKNLPLSYQPLTAKQLAGHLAGMPHYNDKDKIENHFYTTVQDALLVFLHQNLLSTPNTAYNYSTHGFTLLSAAMEGAEGQPYLEYLKNQVLTPLGMKNTEADQRQQKSYENLAKLYEVEKGKYKEIKKPENPSYKWAGGGLLSTPTDLVKMTHAYSNKFLQPEIVKEFFTSQKTTEGKTTQVGIGWRLSKDMVGRDVIEHAGGMEGARTIVCLFPKEELAVSIMVNKEWVSSIEETAHTIASLFLNETTPTQSPTGEFVIETTTTKKNNKTTQKGKLVLKDNQGSITLADGQSFGVFYLGSQNNYAFINSQGIYYMTIAVEGKNATGKAIMYSTMLAESAKDNAPFFEFLPAR